MSVAHCVIQLFSILSSCSETPGKPHSWLSGIPLARYLLSIKWMLKIGNKNYSAYWIYFRACSVAVLQFGFTPLAEKASNRVEGFSTVANQEVLLMSVSCTNLQWLGVCSKFCFPFCFLLVPSRHWNFKLYFDNFLSRCDFHETTSTTNVFSLKQTVKFFRSWK